MPSSRRRVQPEQRVLAALRQCFATLGNTGRVQPDVFGSPSALHSDPRMPATQTVVVTGASSGIGFQTALHFVRGGARVAMACRNLDKAERALSQIRNAVPGASALVLPLDVSAMESVRKF